jgi:hypothetical protein
MGVGGPRPLAAIGVMSRGCATSWNFPRKLVGAAATRAELATNEPRGAASGVRRPAARR